MANQPHKTKSKTRIVKNPETFRQKAIKNEASKQTKPKFFVKWFKQIVKLLSKISRPVSKQWKLFSKTRLGKPAIKLLRLIAKLLFLTYLVASFKELKQVTWPSWKQSWKLTYAVLAFAVVFGAAIAGLDWVLGKIFKQILIK